ncbi:hypothetical protein BJ742DRAFT_807481 [Cladochytrium replicatum]|nr:hypothetical protein BJ742DRAFT_807481 [Cladochytrium replicatum]
MNRKPVQDWMGKKSKLSQTRLKSPALKRTASRISASSKPPLRQTTLNFVNVTPPKQTQSNDSSSSPKRSRNAIASSRIREENSSTVNSNRSDKENDLLDTPGKGGEQTRAGSGKSKRSCENSSLSAEKSVVPRVRHVGDAVENFTTSSVQRRTVRATAPSGRSEVHRLEPRPIDRISFSHSEPRRQTHKIIVHDSDVDSVSSKRKRKPPPTSTINDLLDSDDDSVSSKRKRKPPPTSSTSNSSTLRARNGRHILSDSPPLPSDRSSFVVIDNFEENKAESNRSGSIAATVRPFLRPGASSISTTDEESTQSLLELPWTDLVGRRLLRNPGVQRSDGLVARNLGELTKQRNQIASVSKPIKEGFKSPRQQNHVHRLDDLSRRGGILAGSKQPPSESFDNLMEPTLTSTNSSSFTDHDTQSLLNLPWTELVRYKDANHIGTARLSSAEDVNHPARTLISSDLSARVSHLLSRPEPDHQPTSTNKRHREQLLGIQGLAESPTIQLVGIREHEYPHSAVADPPDDDDRSTISLSDFERSPKPPDAISPRSPPQRLPEQFMDDDLTQLPTLPNKDATTLALLEAEVDLTQLAESLDLPIRPPTTTVDDDLTQLPNETPVLRTPPESRISFLDNEESSLVFDPLGRHYLPLPLMARRDTALSSLETNQAAAFDFDSEPSLRFDPEGRHHLPLPPNNVGEWSDRELVLPNGSMESEEASLRFDPDGRHHLPRPPNRWL